MTQNQVMTAAALGFAGFALFYITRTPAKGAGTVTNEGQRARDQGLVQWFDTISQGERQFSLGPVYGLDYFSSQFR